MSFCGVGTEEGPVLVSCGTSEMASVLLRWLDEQARVPKGSASLHSDGVSLHLEQRALQAVKWFDIRDNNGDVKSALSPKCACLLLKYVTPNKIQINLKERPADMKVMKELLSDCGKCIVKGGEIELQLYYPWREVCSGEADVYLQALVAAQRSSDCITRFRGCLSSWGVKQLPASLEYLGLALCCPDQAHQVLQALKSISLPNLGTLRIHLRSGSLVPDHLAPMIAPAQVNRGQGNVVYISQVLDSDATWVAKALKKLTPPGGKITSLQLPSCELSVDGYESLMRAMASEGVAMGQTVVVKGSRSLMTTDISQLTAITSKYLQGITLKMWGNNDDLDF